MSHRESLRRSRSESPTVSQDKRHSHRPGDRGGDFKQGAVTLYRDRGIPSGVVPVVPVVVGTRGLPVRGCVWSVSSPLQTALRKCDFLQDRQKWHRYVLKAIAYFPRETLTTEEFCRLLRLGTVQERYRAVGDVVDLTDCPQTGYLQKLEILLSLYSVEETTLPRAGAMAGLPMPMLSPFAVGRRLNRLARCLEGVSSIPITPFIRGFLRGVSRTRASSRLRAAGVVGVFAYLTLPELYRLCTVCTDLQVECRAYPDSLFPIGVGLSLPMVLVKGTAERVVCVAGKVQLTKKTADLYRQMPLLLSGHSTVFDIHRKNMPTADYRHLTYLSPMMGQGRNHTLILRGFTPENLLLFLSTVLCPAFGGIAQNFARLELHFKGVHGVLLPGRYNAPQRFAMSRVCNWIHTRFVCLTHLSMTRTGANEHFVCSRTRFVEEIFDQIDRGVPGPSDDPIFRTLRVLHLDCPEVDAAPFLDFVTQFTQLRRLTIRRLNPVFARRDQLITGLLTANARTLRRVEIDFRHHHYGLDPVLSRGVQTIGWSSFVSGMCLRTRAASREVVVQILGPTGVVCSMGSKGWKETGGG